jgi:D-3-phosphoglycerate dehydrogenase
MPSEGDVPLILLAEPMSESAVARLRAAGRVLGPFEDQPDRWRRHLPEADALLVRSHAQVTDEDMAAAPNLKVIGRAGVGLDTIDLRAARRHGIEVVYTPAASTRAVAELTVGLIIALQRHILASDKAVRDGRFIEARRLPGPNEIGQQTVGIVGMGRIGRTVGHICSRGFGAKVLFNDIIPITGLDFAAEERSKTQLYAESDLITLHVPLTNLTRNLINAHALDSFRPTACLINTARGAVVDSAALAAALHQGRLAGAALDVLDVEPPPPDHPLLPAPNCLLSPHVASRTEASLAAMNDVVNDVIAVLAGRAPAFPAP